MAAMNELQAMTKILSVKLATAAILAMASFLFISCGPVEPAVVPVSRVSLNNNSLTLAIGDDATLIATVVPTTTTETVIWESSDETVVSVTQNGRIRGVSQGTATVTVTVSDKSASCLVKVVQSERALLVAFYNATGGDEWTNKDNWCSSKPLSEWYGIKTDDAGHVYEIKLVFNNLTGQIPPELFDLQELQYLILYYNKLTGEIPEEVGNAKKLRELQIYNNTLSGTLPESIYQLSELTTIVLNNNKLSGELSEKIWSMPALRAFRIDNNKFTGELTPAIRNAKNLAELGLGSNFIKGTIPEEITELSNLYLLNIGNSSSFNGVVTEAKNDFSGPIPDNLDKLQNLWYLELHNNNLEGGIPACLARMPNLRKISVYGNKLSGEIPVEVVECDRWESWAADKNIMPQQNGYVLQFGHYESTDFQDDGKVIRLQTHDKGNGINIVITGDCFTDQDIAAGEFDNVARQTMEYFFSIEPFHSFRNLFDVYAVVAVSKTRYSDYGTALGAVFGEGAYVSCEEDKVRAYSLKAVSNLDETLTIVIVNKNSNSGTTFLPYPSFDTDYGSGFSYACFGLQSGPDLQGLINHEANGHGFTKLADEYYYTGSGDYPDNLKNRVKESYFRKGFYANVDFESDPHKVKWAQFLSDERYQYEGLGVFEGGMEYEKGVWRPSDNSIMHVHSSTGEGSRFNAPSRAAAYIRIHKLAFGSDWEFDYEEFVKYDAINRRTSPTASANTSK